MNQTRTAQPGDLPRTRWLNALIILLTLLALAFVSQMVWGLLSQFSDVILLFVFAALVAFALNPLIDAVDNKPLPSGIVKLGKRLPIKWGQRVEHWRISRRVAVVVLYAALALMLACIVAVLIPPVLRQLEQMRDHYSDFAKRVLALTPTLVQGLGGGVHSGDLSTSLSGALGWVQNLVTLALQNTFAFLQGAVNVVGNLALVLVLSFFFALDGPRFLGQAFDLVPRRFDDEIRMLSVTVDRVFGGYLRATLLQSILMGAGTAVAMGLFGAPFLLGASLFAGLFMLIPFVGATLALVPPVLAMALDDPAKAALIFIILLVYQSLVVNVLMPRLLSQALGLHPLIIMASLLIGVKIGGFWGALLGVPVAGVLATMALFFYRRSVHSTKPAAEEQVASEEAAIPGAGALPRQVGSGNVISPVGQVET